MGSKARRRKRFAAVGKVMIFLIAGTAIAEHFYRDEFKSFCKDRDTPLHQFCQSLGDGSWFILDKTPLGQDENAPMGQIKYTKDMLNKRTVTANDIINEDRKK